MEKWLVALSIVIGFLTLWAGIMQYRQTSTRVAMAPFLDLQLENYASIMRVTGLMASTGDLDKFGHATDDFWELYYGSLALVEDTQVANEMIKIGELLNSSSPTELMGSDKLKNASLRLADACRDSISISWKIDLSTLEKRLTN